MCVEILEQARGLLLKEYGRIWNDWYGHLDATRAELVVEEGNHSSGYRRKENQLCLYFPEANLNEVIEELAGTAVVVYRNLGWSLWRREPIHEMLHEYQFKVIRGEVTDAGRALHNESALISCERGHGPDFFTAIADRARYFDMEPNDLVRNL